MLDWLKFHLAIHVLRYAINVLIEEPDCHSHFIPNWCPLIQGWSRWSGFIATMLPRGGRTSPDSCCALASWWFVGFTTVASSMASIGWWSLGHEGFHLGCKPVKLVENLSIFQFYLGNLLHELRNQRALRGDGVSITWACSIWSCPP